MRIVVANWSARKVGGTESYLDEIVPQLQGNGHEVAFLSEFDVPANRQRIRLSKSGLWCASRIGQVNALAAVRQWSPDLVYVHKMSDTALEEQLLDIAPAVLFVHDYNGLCISGLKAFKFPREAPCSRVFGWHCLYHYMPHRCGGRNPLTMWRLFRMQSRRLKLFRRYQAIVTHSEYMLSELLRHGIEPEKAHKSLYLVDKPSSHASQLLPQSPAELCHAVPTLHKPTARLIFSGRMDRLKGGAVLIDALPKVAASLERPVLLTFAGEGPARRSWQKQARAVEAHFPKIRIEFPGWLDDHSLPKLFSQSDLLVVPSLWPEPFGRVGPEAGSRSLPAAAFSVGGVSEWLLEGVNGFLAPANPPTASGLAEAIVKCLSDSKIHAQLRSGALQVAQRFSPINHMAQLIRLFETCLKKVDCIS